MFILFSASHTGGFEGLGGAGCDNDDPLVNLSNDSRYNGSPKNNNGYGSSGGGYVGSSGTNPSGAITHVNGEEFNPKRNYLVSVVVSSYSGERKYTLYIVYRVFTFSFSGLRFTANFSPHGRCILHTILGGPAPQSVEGLLQHLPVSRMGGRGRQETRRTESNGATQWR